MFHLSYICWVVVYSFIIVIINLITVICLNTKALTISLIIIIILGTGLYLIYSQNQPEQINVRSTTTTSLYATGLLDYLNNKFHEKYPEATISFIPVGSGEALKRAEKGDACMVLVHAPSLEKNYIDNNIIEYHKIFAYNYFIMVGPESDPANVKNATSIEDAMQRIYQAGEEGKALFISRGDNSGTNVKELQLWRLAGLVPKGKDWYLEVGKGMGETLVTAYEKDAYTLSDIGTYLKYKKDGRIPGLTIIYSNDTMLINIYSAYLVKSCQGQERELAKQFIDFLVSSEGQELIANYGVDKYGQPLFYPAQGKLTELEQTWNQLANQG